METGEENSTENKLTEETKVIVEKLKQYSDSGLKFESAKDKLISDGFTQDAISLATENYEYGAKQASDVPEKVTEYYNAHPDEVVKDGDSLLKAQHTEDVSDQRTQAVLDVMAETGADELGTQGIDAQVEYKSKFASDVGVSFWLLVILGVVINAVAFLLVNFLHIKGWFYIINAILTLLLIIYLIMRIK